MNILLCGGWLNSYDVIKKYREHCTETVISCDFLLLGKNKDQEVARIYSFKDQLKVSNVFTKLIHLIFHELDVRSVGPSKQILPHGLRRSVMVEMCTYHLSIYSPYLALLRFIRHLSDQTEFIVITIKKSVYIAERVLG